MAQNITVNETISLTAEYTPYTQQVVKDILYAYAHIVHKLLKMGYNVNMPTLGKFCLSQYKGSKEYTTEWADGKKIHHEAIPPYKKPTFRFAPAVCAEIRELTEGDA